MCPRDSWRTEPSCHHRPRQCQQCPSSTHHGRLCYYAPQTKNTGTERWASRAGLSFPYQLNFTSRLAASRTLQIFNLETKQKVKTHASTEDIVFWKWVSDSTIGLVTETSVYHWTIADATSAPQKVFDRHPTLAGSQIINYRVTPDEKWLVLVGISGNPTNPAGFNIKGAMQLYSKDRGISQPIEGHAAAFAEMKLDGYAAPVKLFTFS